MSEMVERVARSIIAGFDEITEPEERAECLKLARAAIEAMREPTEGMVAAPITENIQGIWQAMIDEALK